jgi:hypothetical protein
MWLKEHNPLYKDIELDYEALAELPEEGMIPEAYSCMTFCNRMKDDSKAHSRYDAPDISEGAIHYGRHVLIRVDNDSDVDADRGSNREDGDPIRMS